MHFYFSFDQVTDGSYGMKFAFILKNYQWISNDDDARFVLDVEMRLCPGMTFIFVVMTLILININ